MKKNLFFSLLMIACLFTYTSCDDKDDFNPDNETLKILEEKIETRYPGALIVEYDQENSRIEAEIRHNGISKEVYFDMNYEWLYTEWEISYKDVPQTVKTSLNDSNYKDYRIDDIHVIEKQEGLSYVFELELKEQEIYLTIKADGTILD